MSTALDIFNAIALPKIDPEFEPVILELPLPPSGNNNWGERKGGGKFLKAHVKAFRAEVIEECMIQKIPMNLEGALQSTVILMAPDYRTRDTDNFGGKTLYDAMQHAGVYKNDSQCRNQLHYWGPNIAGGRCLVKLQRLQGMQTAHNQLDLMAG